MKRALVTGLNGRLAPFLKAKLEAIGVAVVPFDRSKIDILNLEAQRQFIYEQRLDCVFHLATGPEQWVEYLATICKEQNTPFVFTSTESVFNPDSTGPFKPTDKADAVSEYGRYKINCENSALAANPDSIIARLGWQMFDTFDKDNLLTHVRDMHDKNGYIDASTLWLPAVANIKDTLDCLITLAMDAKPGIYHIDGNESGLSFYDLVCLINQKYLQNWEIRPSIKPNRDGRIVDDRVQCKLIDASLA